MEYTEVTVAVPCARVDEAAAIANMVVPYGVYIEDYSDLEQGAREIAHIDLIDEELLARDRTRALIHVYLSPDQSPAEAVAFLRERLTAAGIRHEVDTGTVREEDWANNWKAYFKPLPVGKRLLIQPTWEAPAAPEGRVVLSIDPGMAFGTGGHDTTRLVLEAIEEYLCPGDAVLDVGCGSGILSIAALLLGAGRAVGVDIDPTAVRTARENGVLNGFQEPVFTVRQGDLATQVEGEYRLVVANIVADAILALTPSVERFLVPGGVYIVSGIIDTREAEVTAGLRACGYAIERRLEHGGWVCLVTAR